MSQGDYYVTHFAEDVRTHLEAGVFRAICKHLSDRSADVENIDMMIIGGFSRNCLAKVSDLFFLPFPLICMNKCNFCILINSCIHWRTNIIYVFENFSLISVACQGSKIVVE